MFRLTQWTALLAIILTSISPSRAQSASAPAACVRLFQQTSRGINLQITTLDTRTGKSSTTTQPTIPPQPWLSPDGKYAAFWQMKGNDLVGLYLSPVIDSAPVLLYETSQSDAWNLLLYHEPVPFGWSPDSSKFAFFGQKDDKYFLTVTSPDGKTKNTRQILTSSGQSSISHVVFYGWSADSKYLAADIETPVGTPASTNELGIWAGTDMSEVTSGLNITPSAVFQYYFPATWSPRGHQLATILDSESPTPGQNGSIISKLSIWTPERVIMAAEPVDAGNFATVISWAPDGQQIQVQISGGDGPSPSEIYGVANGILRKNQPDKASHYFAGWSADEQAIVTDQVGASWNSKVQIAIIDANKGTYKVVVPNVVSGNHVLVLPDGKRIAFITQDKESSQSNVKYKGILIDSDGLHAVTFFDEPYLNPSPPPSYFLDTVFDWNPVSGKVMLRWSWNGENQPDVVSVGPDGLNPVKTKFLFWIDSTQYIDAVNVGGSYHLEWVNRATATATNIAPLISNQAQGPFRAGLSPDKRRAVIVVGVDTLVLVSLDGAQPTVVRQLSATAFDISYIYFGNKPWIPDYYSEGLYVARWFPYSFSWSPDVSMLAFANDDKPEDGLSDALYGNQRQLVVVNRDGTERWRVSIPDVSGGDPTPKAAIQWVPCES